MEEKNKEELLLEDNRTLEEIIAEIAEEENLTTEEVMAMFKKGMQEANNKPKINTKQKAKNRAKNKQARKARKKNR